MRGRFVTGWEEDGASSVCNIGAKKKNYFILLFRHATVEHIVNMECQYLKLSDEEKTSFDLHILKFVGNVEEYVAKQIGDDRQKWLSLI